MQRILLIEDDEISMRYIADALALLPVLIDECRNFSTAKMNLETTFYDLIISDIHLPDGILFEDAQFFPEQIKKIAISAEINPSISFRLTAIGFDTILPKPMSLDILHHTVRQILDLKLAANNENIFWDDQKGLSALGNNGDSLKILKNLFKAELPQMLLQINLELANNNHQKIEGILHKLKASCGFLGANRLLAECYSFESNISNDSLAEFTAVAQQTLNTI